MTTIFHVLVYGHIAVGSIGLVAFWVPILSKKGGINHRWWGKVFTWSMLITGAIAVGISTCTLIAPRETHPLINDEALIVGIFGWMMMYLAILTINLAWYSWQCVLNKREHRRNRSTVNVFLQVILFIAALNCAVQGLLIWQPLMMGIAVVGFATVATNLYFMFKAEPGRIDWQYEHIKGGVGAGISVYTAFFAFGAVRLMPELALNPVLWAVPLTTGIAMILYHWRQVSRRFAPAQSSAVAQG